MKNVTITVEDRVLEWVRVEAAKRGTNVAKAEGCTTGHLFRGVQ